MDNNDMLQQLQTNKAALLRLLNSPDGKKLVALLQQQAGSGNLKRAAGEAARGDTAGITQILQNLAKTPEGAAVVQRINQSMEP